MLSNVQRITHSNTLKCSKYIYNLEFQTYKENTYLTY